MEAVTEPTMPGEILARHQRLTEAAVAYDTSAYPDLEFLRPHQLDFLDATLAYSAALTPQALAQPEGACILSPPGSGKTITALSVVRAHEFEGRPPKTLYFMPRRIIKADTLMRFREFAPDIAIEEYSRDRKRLGDPDVMLMTYQALEGALQSDFFDNFNPDLLIADEVHHVIDGEWSKLYRQIALGRMSLGMTATPAYNHMRNVRALFPTVLAHKTFKEGVDQGLVSPFRSYIYRSNVQSYDDTAGMVEDIFSALNIAHQKALEGKIGIIACTPGDDTAHARSVETLSALMDQSKGLQRPSIRAISGNMHEKLIVQLLDNLKKGKIDALAYTHMLGEGVDLPEIDYMILLGWTESVVLAAQRLGRATRLGKIRDVFEFLRPGFVSHIDAFNEDFNPTGPAPRYSNGLTIHQSNTVERHYSHFSYDTLIQSADGRHYDDVDDSAPILQYTDAVDKGVAYEFKTLAQISRQFFITEASARLLLEASGIGPTPITIRGEERNLYPPEAQNTILAALNPGIFDEAYYQTFWDALRQYRRSHANKSISINAFIKQLESDGISPVVLVGPDGGAVQAVPLRAPRKSLAQGYSARGLQALAERRRNFTDRAVDIDPAKQKVPMELQLEKIILSLVPRDGQSALDRSKLDKRLKIFRTLCTQASAKKPIVNEKFVADVEALDPQSFVARNLTNMSAKLNVSTAQLAGILLGLNSHVD